MSNDNCKLPLTPAVLCLRCTADTFQDNRDPENPGNVCRSCGWDSRKDRDCDLAAFRSGPHCPCAPRAIGAESVPVLLGEADRLRASVAQLEAAPTVPADLLRRVLEIPVRGLETVLEHMPSNIAAECRRALGEE